MRQGTTSAEGQRKLTLDFLRRAWRRWLQPDKWPVLWHDVASLLQARWYLRKATRGRLVRLWGRALVKNYGEMTFGDRVRLTANIVPIELYTAFGATLSIGDDSFINYGCSIAASQRIEIGPRCNIGTYVIMMDNDFHRIEPERRAEMPESAPIILEENVWLGARVTVLRGVRIGGGSVVAAGSVVTKDIPPRSLAAGVPARVIRAL